MLRALFLLLSDSANPTPYLVLYCIRKALLQHYSVRLAVMKVYTRFTKEIGNHQHVNILSFVESGPYFSQVLGTETAMDSEASNSEKQNVPVLC
jgi:hypothetical protein